MSTWLGDACSLVDAFRTGQLNPAETLEATLGAIERSRLNAFSFVDAERARAAAREVDVFLPLGGVPIGIKELNWVEGWPATEASLAFKDRVAHYTSTMVQRLLEAGAIPVGLTTASEFGGLNVSITKLNGMTSNPWNTEKTAGGSSGGSASAVAGGLVPLATGGDGGGSIRIPAGFTGLVGMKGTYGRIPRGPKVPVSPFTAVGGCLARSVRDIARYFDVTNGFDAGDPYSLPRVEGWERDLDSYDLSGKRAVIAPNLGTAVIRPEVEAAVTEAGEALARAASIELVDIPVELPGLGVEWALANMASILVDLGDAWPDSEADLTEEIAFGINFARENFNLEMAAVVERNRVDANQKLATLFEEVDFVIAATNPDIAFPAQVRINLRVGDEQVGPENNGALTFPANMGGNPAVSIPIGTFDGLPVGMQVIGRNHEDALLLDLATIFERERPWPLTAPGAPL